VAHAVDHQKLSARDGLPGRPPTADVAHEVVRAMQGSIAIVWASPRASPSGATRQAGRTFTQAAFSLRRSSARNSA
jgi:hypothetical protein